jgi:hypothetical protein
VENKEGFARPSKVPERAAAGMLSYAGTGERGNGGVLGRARV